MSIPYTRKGYLSNFVSFVKTSEIKRDKEKALQDALIKEREELERIIATDEIIESRWRSQIFIATVMIENE